MADPFIGEIRLFAGNFAPVGWAFCNGQLLAISSNDALFSLLGTTYGGNGTTTFGLPDFRGRVPIHMGTGSGLSPRVMGQMLGSENVTLTTAQIPAHTHAPSAATSGNVSSPAGAFLATAQSAQAGTRTYSTVAPDTSLNAGSVSNAGSSVAHENCQPFVCVTYIIALFGIFPSRN